MCKLIKTILIIGVATYLCLPCAIAADHPDLQKKNERAEMLTLDRRVTDLEAKITSINEAYRMILNIAQIAAAIGGLIGLFLMIDRWRERKLFAEKTKRIEEEATRTRIWYEQLMKRQEESNNKLFESVQANIDEASSLFGALKDMLSLKEDAEKIEQGLVDRQRQIRLGVIQDLNAEAVQICRRVTRSNYSSIDLQDAIHEFAAKLKQYRKEYTIEDSELGASCILAMGLDLRVRDLDLRLKLLEQACEFGMRDLRRVPSEELGVGMSTDEFREWSKACTNEALYHLAIVLYNTGEYRQAITKFEEAIKFNESDVSSKLYIPEAKFLGFLEKDFKEIVGEFESIAKNIQESQQTGMWSEEQRNALLSLTYVRLGNCYFARSKFEPFRKYRSLQRATDCFSKARELCPTSYLACFSYAQALSAWAAQLEPEAQGRGKLITDAEKLFTYVFSKIRDKLATTSEPKIRLMLFYMLAICAKEGNIRGEIPQAYIAQIYSEKGNLGTDSRLRIFSPRTKNDLSVEEFIHEVEEFQRRL